METLSPYISATRFDLDNLRTSHFGRMNFFSFVTQCKNHDIKFSFIYLSKEKKLQFVFRFQNTDPILLACLVSFNYTSSSLSHQLLCMTNKHITSRFLYFWHAKDVEKKNFCIGR